MNVEEPVENVGVHSESSFIGLAFFPNDLETKTVLGLATALFYLHFQKQNCEKQ